MTLPMWYLQLPKSRSQREGGELLPYEKDALADFACPGLSACLLLAKIGRLTISVFGGKNSSEKYEAFGGRAAILSVIFVILPFERADIDD